MRLGLDGLDVPVAFSASLPGVYHDDELAHRLLDAFDQVIAPILCTLDNIDSYVDPALAPEDFVGWLASWVGLVLDESWPLERLRELVGRSHDLFRWRGTARGLTEQIALYTGTMPELSESGGCAWSPTPGGRLPGSPASTVTVTLRVGDPAAIDAKRVEAIVAMAKPAHIEHRVEVVAT